MRACDHKAIQDLHILEYVPPDQQKSLLIFLLITGIRSFPILVLTFKIPAEKV